MDQLTNESKEWFVGIEKICELFSMSDSSVRRLCKQNKNPMPCYKVNKKLMFDPHEVRKWFKNHRAA